MAFPFPFQVHGVGPRAAGTGTHSELDHLMTVISESGHLNEGMTSAILSMIVTVTAASLNISFISTLWPIPRVVLLLPFHSLSTLTVALKPTAARSSRIGGVCHGPCGVRTNPPHRCLSLTPRCPFHVAPSLGPLMIMG